MDSPFAVLLAIVWNVPFMEGCGLIQCVEAFKGRAVANNCYFSCNVRDAFDVKELAASHRVF